MAITVSPTESTPNPRKHHFIHKTAEAKLASVQAKTLIVNPIEMNLP